LYTAVGGDEALVVDSGSKGEGEDLDHDPRNRSRER